MTSLQGIGLAPAPTQASDRQRPVTLLHQPIWWAAVGYSILLLMAYQLPLGCPVL